MTDLLRKASGSTRAVPTTLSLPKANGSTTAELTVATGWNTTTDLDVIIYRRQLNTTTGLYEKVAGTQTEWVADSLTGTTLAGMVLRAGTEPASGYAADGNTVVMCGPTSAYADDLYIWGNSFATPQGALRSSAVQTALGISGGAGDGWSILNAGTAPTVATGYNKGNKEYDLTFAGVDLTSVLSAGMRLKLTRGTTAPTQCADLESSSSQYASKTSPTGISFTDDFTCEAWVKVESYTGLGMTIISRFNGTSGWEFRLGTAGQIEILGYNAAGANVSYSQSYQSVPLNQWVHIAATLDMSTFTAAGSPMYLNGTLIPSTVARGGTNPTALVQAGDLQIGRVNTAGFFDGKIADVRLWSVVRTATQIRDNMNQQLVGNETNLVAYYKLNGNLNDSTSNANNLTGSGGAVATDTDNPMKSTEYAIVIKVSFSTNTTATVLTGTDYNIPNMTLSNPYYSTQSIPFGFPVSLASNPLLVGETLIMSNTSTTNTTPTQIPGHSITVSATMGKRYRIHLTGYDLFTSSTTAGAEATIWAGTVGSGQRLQSQLGFQGGGSSAGNFHTYIDYVAPTTASLTFNAGLNAATAATAQIQGATIYPCVFQVEQL